jgi:hypothetical protein
VRQILVFSCVNAPNLPFQDAVSNHLRKQQQIAQIFAAEEE